MQAINNVLIWINDNWTAIIICIGLCIGIYKKIKSYMQLTTDQKYEAALVSVKAILLEKMANAEIDWADYKKSGELKKSRVFSELYKQFPILKDYINQDKVVEDITKMIDEEMDNMNKVVKSIGTTSNTETSNKTTDKKED